MNPKVDVYSAIFGFLHYQLCKEFFIYLTRCTGTRHITKYKCQTDWRGIINDTATTPHRRPSGRLFLVGNDHFRPNSVIPGVSNRVSF